MGNLLHGPVDEQICHAGPLLLVERPPVPVRADHRRGGYLADLLQGPVPVQDAVFPVDDEGRDEGPADDTVQDGLVCDERLRGQYTTVRCLNHRRPLCRSEMCARIKGLFPKGPISLLS